MAARVVKANELNRVLAVLDSRGLRPTTCTILPGGAVRLHLVDPIGDDADREPEVNEWDAALR